MYLGVRLLEGRKALRKKDKLPKAGRDEGPDFCIQKGRRRIWIEVIAPSPGDETNLDKVPDLFASGAENDNRRKIELRIASALKTKTDKFGLYRKKGIIGPNDFCVVAIAASQFALEADVESGAGLPPPVTTVFPFGEEVITIDPETAEFTSLSRRYSGEIERAEKDGKTQRRAAHGLSERILRRHRRPNLVPTLNWHFPRQHGDLIFVHNHLPSVRCQNVG